MTHNKISFAPKKTNWAYFLYKFNFSYKLLFTIPNLNETWLITSYIKAFIQQNIETSYWILMLIAVIDIKANRWFILFFFLVIFISLTVVIFNWLKFCIIVCNHYLWFTECPNFTGLFSILFGINIFAIILIPNK